VQGGVDPSSAVADPFQVDEPEPERENEQRTRGDERDTHAGQPQQERGLVRPVAAARGLERGAAHDRAREEQKPAEQVEEKGPGLGVGDHGGSVSRRVGGSGRALAGAVS
jgi:hypothetical protein